jgi:hypothetical protein
MPHGLESQQGQVEPLNSGSPGLRKVSHEEDRGKAFAARKDHPCLISAIDVSSNRSSKVSAADTKTITHAASHLPISSGNDAPASRSTNSPEPGTRLSSSSTPSTAANGGNQHFQTGFIYEIIPGRLSFCTHRYVTDFWLHFSFQGFTMRVADGHFLCKEGFLFKLLAVGHFVLVRV